MLPGSRCETEGSAYTTQTLRAPFGIIGSERESFFLYIYKPYPQRKHPSILSNSVRNKQTSARRQSGSKSKTTRADCILPTTRLGTVGYDCLVFFFSFAFRGAVAFTLVSSLKVRNRGALIWICEFLSERPVRFSLLLTRCEPSSEPSRQVNVHVFFFKWVLVSVRVCLGLTFDSASGISSKITNQD